MKIILKITVFSAVFLMLAGGLVSCEGKEKLQWNDCLGEERWFEVNNVSRYSDVVGMKFFGQITRSFYDFENIELGCAYWEDGGIRIVLPKTVKPNYLRPLDYGGHLFPPTISNENVRVIRASLQGVDKDDSWAENFSPFKEIEDGFVMAFFIYADSDVTISGHNKINQTFVNGIEQESTIIHSIELKKGWNIQYYSRTVKRVGNKITLTEQTTTSPVNGLRWYGDRESLDIRFRPI